MRDDGEVRFNFTQAKQTLELFRAIAAGETTAFEKLCEQFNNDTGHGGDMSRYTELLEKAVQAIRQTFKKRNIGSLLAGRDGKLVARSKQISGVEDFELISWLVIRDGKHRGVS